MASNAELTAQILKITPDADVKGKNNAELSKILRGMTPAPAADAQAAKEAADAEPPRHVVRGHAVTTRRGILSDDAEIHADDVGGIEALDALSALGIVK